MSLIKGQNLRLFDVSNPSDRVIAMSTTCTVHVSLLLSEVSTKDDIDEWVRQQPVGHSWDCSVDALVPAVDSAREMTSDSAGTIGDVEYFCTPIIHLPPDKRIVAAIIGETSDDYICITNVPLISNADILEEGNRKAEYINLSGVDMDIAICTRVQDADVVYFIADANAMTLEDIEVGQKLNIVFATAMEDYDEKNRALDTALLSGDAIVSDISINASNRQNITYQIQLTGDGPLTQY